MDGPPSAMEGEGTRISAIKPGAALARTRCACRCYNRKMKNKTAVIQVRVSSKRQADKELPLESQLQRCQDLAKRLGTTVTRVFVEKGQSGWSGPRPVFEEALQYCEKTLPDYFITWSTSRFSRNQEVSISSRARLERVGTEVAYASFDAGADPDTRFLSIGFRELMDEYKSREISKDTKRSMARNAQNGFWNGGRVPFGYMLHRTESGRQRLVINNIEARVVRKIFSMRLSGKGSLLIARELNENHEYNRNAGWNKSSITNVLKSEAVHGCVAYGKRTRPSRRLLPRDQWIIVKSHEAIIDDETWNKVQVLISESTPTQGSGSPRSKFIFSGLMRCGQCGGSLQIETARNSAGTTYAYYNCRNALKNGTCDNRRITANELDNFLIDAVVGRVLTKRNMEQIFHDMQKACGAFTKEQKTRIVTLNIEIRELQRRNEKLMATIEEHNSEIADMSLLVNRMNVNNARIQSAVAEIEEIESCPVPEISLTAEEVGKLSSFCRKVIKTTRNPEKTRGFLKAMIERVIIRDATAEIYYRPELLMRKQNVHSSGWLAPRDGHTLNTRGRIIKSKRFVINLPERWHRKVA